MHATARWRILSLDELIQSGAVRLGRGKVISKTDLAETPGTFPVYSSAREDDGKFGEYGKYLFDEELITWSVDGGGRLFHRLRHKFSVTNVGGFLRILRKDLISYRFLYYALTLEHSRVKFDWVKKAHPSTLRKEYKNIPLPSLSEQKRIVTILDEAFEGIEAAVANAEKNLVNARELFDSYLNSMFINKGPNWTMEPLGKSVRFIDYRGKTPPKRDAGVRLITAKNVKMGFIQRAPEEFVDPSAYDAWMTRGIPKRGDVLFTTEAPLGNVAQLDTDETVIIGQRLITFQPDNQVLDRTFLKFALMSQPIQQEILKRKTGATVSGIKASLLKLVPIHFPKKTSEQVAIAARIAEISETCLRVESIYLQKLDALDKLKQAILQKAFAGGLTAQSAKALPQAAE